MSEKRTDGNDIKAIKKNEKQGDWLWHVDVILAEMGKSDILERMTAKCVEGLDGEQICAGNVVVPEGLKKQNIR